MKKLVGAFDIIGKLKTVEEPRKVFCGTTVKNVRIEILLADDSISIKIAVGEN